MKEDFLHYVWQHQYFDKADLRTQQGEEITVLRPGYRNADAGPDFLNARLQIGEVEWNGAVEIHLRASDWLRHQHQTDPKYDQVILHVVYTADQDIVRTNGSLIPALALAPRIALSLVHTYLNLVDTGATATLPCAALLPRVPIITRTMMVERALLERVEQKADDVAALHEQLGQDWEATAYHVVAAGFGFKKNSEPLARLAKALPLAVVRRHRHEERQLEALLFGQAGFLADAALLAEDEYLRKLAQEYEFLRHKYQLAPAALAVHEWNFLRLRPANFPTVRLAQLVAVLHARPVLFNALLTAADIRTLEQFFLAPVPVYWRQHYRPAKPGKVPALGRSSLHLLIANVVVPLRVAHARYVGQPELIETAVALLEHLPAEHNYLTEPYELLGFEHRSAADSQGLLSLNRAYCVPRRCLRCSIGSQILQQNLVLG
ncbi:DUF2851 family protein [Hymenobacter cellulosilyticus]|uniref:DUF2851 family protein n=1 Tax=Hymenobacter cellulosilyticus TaxID=2932248 RepID=A0A8T9Q0U3_9BACT|nr:DUF2851 family protein [Hymenobacter cellulosilyticus]UOQ70635.1 DUF2851 family protein [Hymenobacter cellulosilyticus]